MNGFFAGIGLGAIVTALAVSGALSLVPQIDEDQIAAAARLEEGASVDAEAAGPAAGVVAEGAPVESEREDSAAELEPAPEPSEPEAQAEPQGDDPAAEMVSETSEEMPESEPPAAELEPEAPAAELESVEPEAEVASEEATSEPAAAPEPEAPFIPVAEATDELLEPEPRPEPQLSDVPPEAQTDAPVATAGPGAEGSAPRAGQGRDITLRFVDAGSGVGAAPDEGPRPPAFDAVPPVPTPEPEAEPEVALAEDQPADPSADGTIRAEQPTTPPDLPDDFDLAGVAPSEEPESPTTDRLPQIGVETAEETPAPEEVADDRPALVRNAVAEPPSSDVPRMAIVLVDTPASEIVDDLQLSVAIAADSANAGTRASDWQAAGQEIVAIPGAPNGQPSGGAGGLFEATFDALPQATSVIAETDRGFSGDPQSAREIADRLAETGHGLIVRDTVDPAVRAAEAEGVPTIRVFRRVDGSGRDGRAIARFLDQAAFEARQRGALVVIADNSPETADALRRFAQSSRAASVALVPISALLRAQ